jgi:hypothetical protein
MKKLSILFIFIFSLFTKSFGTMQSGASGGRYSVAGKVLTLKQNGSRDSSFVAKAIM